MALRGLDSPPALVLVFPDADMPWDDVVRQGSAVPAGCRVAGMTSEGLITGATVGTRGCAALAFAEDTAVGVGIARDASRDMHAAGRAAAEEALRELAPHPGHAALLLFLDPRSGDEAAAIDGAYSVAGARMPLAGGGANGPAPGVIADGDMRSDAIVAVALCSR